MCAWLADHPQATCSTRKETFYLLDTREWIIDKAVNYHTKGLEGYHECFPEPKPGSKIAFEGTTLYFYQKTALDVLSALEKKPKMLFIFREPSRRIYSNYQYFYNNKSASKDNTTFAQYLDLVKKGHDFAGNNQMAQVIDHSDYAAYLAKWYEQYGAENVKVWIFERMVKDPKAYMKELCEWLEIDPSFFEDYGYGKENETYKVKNRFLHALSIWLGPLISQGSLRVWIRNWYRKVNTGKLDGPTSEDQACMKALREEMKPSVERLEAMLGYKIPEWS